jgi:hypothetical protein
LANVGCTSGLLEEPPSNDRPATAAAAWMLTVVLALPPSQDALPPSQDALEAEAEAEAMPD